MFLEVVQRCVKSGLVDGKELAADGTYLPVNVSADIQFSNSPERCCFYYLPKENTFCCPESIRLIYQRLICSQTTGKYLRCYQVQGDTCKHYKRNSIYFKQAGIRCRILGSSCYPAFYRGHERIDSGAYWYMMRLRKIWAEGSFSVLKREHCLSKIRKRGIPAVTEECRLSAMALNLKRGGLGPSVSSHICWKSGQRALDFCPDSFFQQVQFLVLPSRAMFPWCCATYSAYLSLKKEQTVYCLFLFIKAFLNCYTVYQRIKWHDVMILVQHNKLYVRTMFL